MELEHLQLVGVCDLLLLEIVILLDLLTLVGGLDVCHFDLGFDLLELELVGVLGLGATVLVVQDLSRNIGLVLVDLDGQYKFLVLLAACLGHLPFGESAFVGLFIELEFLGVVFVFALLLSNFTG